MSIQSEIDRIKGNVSDTLSVLDAAGVDITGAGSNELPALVAIRHRGSGPCGPDAPQIPGPVAERTL